MFPVFPLHLTDSSTLEDLVVVISHSDANVHRVAHLFGLFDGDQTMLEYTPRDKVESIRIEWEGESGLSSIGVL
jgi:hypothetical protein